jgi:hypothetical protein
VRIVVRAVGNDDIAAMFDLRKGSLQRSQFYGVEQIRGEVDDEDMRVDLR